MTPNLWAARNARTAEAAACLARVDHPPCPCRTPKPESMRSARAGLCRLCGGRIPTATAVRLDDGPTPELSPFTDRTLDAIIAEATATKPAGMKLSDAVALLIVDRAERGILAPHQVDELRAAGYGDDRPTVTTENAAIRHAPTRATAIRLDDGPRANVPAAQPCQHCGHDADHIDPSAGCPECNDAAQVGQYAPCQLTAPDAPSSGGAEGLPDDLAATPDPDAPPCPFCGGGLAHFAECTHAAPADDDAPWTRRRAATVAGR